MIDKGDHWIGEVGDEFENISLSAKDLRLKVVSYRKIECTQPSSEYDGWVLGETSEDNGDFKKIFWRPYKGKSENAQDFYQRIK